MNDESYRDSCRDLITQKDDTELTYMITQISNYITLWDTRQNVGNVIFGETMHEKYFF